jgi:hypothetical protein
MAAGPVSWIHLVAVQQHKLLNLENCKLVSSFFRY